MSDAPLTGVVALLDEASLDDLIGVIEVLAQEGVPNLSLPAGLPALEELAALYGTRIRIGVHGPIDTSAEPASLGADFWRRRPGLLGWPAMARP